MLIQLNDYHVKICKEWASFRRTLTQATRLLDEGSDADPQDVFYCLRELEEIIPTIEALQFAVRSAII
jgi:mannitol/fructose-specific phosphotransferase system IIA component (Ntr-type)